MLSATGCPLAGILILAISLGLAIVALILIAAYAYAWAEHAANLINHTEPK